MAKKTISLNESDIRNYIRNVIAESFEGDDFNDDMDYEDNSEGIDYGPEDDDFYPEDDYSEDDFYPEDDFYAKDKEYFDEGDGMEECGMPFSESYLRKVVQESVRRAFRKL